MQAFHFLEAGRAGALLDSLASRRRLQAALLPESLRAADEAARARGRLARARYRKEVDAGASAEAPWREVEAAQEHVLSVARRIQREAKAQAGVLYVAPDSLEDIQRSLRPDEALVLYGPKVALVVTPKEARTWSSGTWRRQRRRSRRRWVVPTSAG